MSQIKPWLLLVLGLGLVAVALQGVARGWLPNGRNGFKLGQGVNRESQPLGFWIMFILMFILYCGGGAYVMWFALRLLV